MKAFLVILLAYGLLNPLCLCGGVAASGAFGVAAKASPQHHHHGHRHGGDESTHGGEDTDDDHSHEHFHSEVKAPGPSPADAPSLLPAVAGPMEHFAKPLATVSPRQEKRSRLFESGVPPPDSRHDPAASGVFLI